MAVVGKLYLAKPHSSANIGQTARLELRGTVNLDVYGSENSPASISEMSKVNVDTLIADSYYALDTLPTYITFVGTSDTINVGGYDLELVGDIS